MKKNKKRFFRYLVLVLLSVVVFSITSCQEPPAAEVEDDSIVSGPGTMTLDDNTPVQCLVVTNKQVTCTEVTDPDPTVYDLTNVIMPLVQIEGELDESEAEISFSYLDATAPGFTTEHSIAFWNTDRDEWETVTSTVESLGLEIKATIEHFSVWTVVELQPVDVDISGTVTIDMGEAWITMNWVALDSKPLSVLLLDSTTQEPVEGKIDYAVRDDWVEQSANVYTFDYSITAVEAGNYVIGAIIDMDGDSEHEGDEPLTLYGGADPTEITVSTDDDFADIDMSLETVSIAGTVTLDADFESDYSGQNIGLVLLSIDDQDELIAARYILEDNSKYIGNFNFGDSIASIDYTVAGVPTAYYIVAAFVDLNGNDAFDIEDNEPYGIIAENGDPSDPLIVLLEDDLIEADILIDTGSLPVTTGVQTHTANTVSFDMIAVSAGGPFTMGEDVESPTQSVTLTNNFWLGETEVTQALWEDVWGTDWPNTDPADSTSGAGDNYPAYFIDRFEAAAFCNLLTEVDPAISSDQKVYYYDDEFQHPYTTGHAENNDQVYADWSKTGYRLPTSAEWEYAARYIDGSTWNPGNHASGDTSGPCYGSGELSVVFNDYAWSWENYTGTTHIVGQKLPNELGLYDMSGNVREWCWDVDADYSGGSETDPTGPDPTTGSQYVMRGGDYYSDIAFCRTAFPWHSYGLSSSYNLGFRLCRTDD